MRRALIMVAAPAVLLASRVGAQGVTVHGVAYDSLHNARLAGAFIAIAGTSRTALSDAQGVFAFDSVAPGTYRFVMQHDALDAIGMSGVSSRVVVSDGRDTVRIAVPSFAQLWRTACGSSPPADSGMLFGTVRDGVSRRQRRASVRASWIDVGFDKTTGVNQKSWHFDVASDSVGGYVLCGVPRSTGIEIVATTDSTMSGKVNLAPLDKERIARRDLMLGAPRALDASTRGVVTGTVTGDNGPIADARVFTDSTKEVRTAGNGRFVLRNVPVGTQQIEVRAIGLAPASSIVDVVASDTSRVDVHLGKVTLLDSVRVTGEAIARRRLVTQFMERRRAGIGYFRDSTQLTRFNTLEGMFADMPSAKVQSKRGKYGMALSIQLGACNPVLWIDRVRVDGFDELNRFRNDDIAALEVYRKGEVPAEFNPKGGSGCAVVVWSKRGWP
jgi:carboxypeptidase family protein